MDSFTFISKLVGSLAWPGVVFTAVVMLREPLRELLPALRKARYKELEFEFGAKLEELEAQAKAAQLPPPDAKRGWVFENPDDWTFGGYLERLAPIGPRATVVEAWRGIELTLVEAAKRVDLPVRTGRMADLIDQLEKGGVIPRDAARLAHELRILRNKAAHASDLDLEPEQALEFARLAERVIASIRVGADRADARALKPAG